MKRKYPDWPIQNNYDDGFAETAPVGTFPANPYGLHDLGGNVWQWCEDWFDQNQGLHVLRGGAWDSLPAPSVVRGCGTPTERKAKHGFRVVLALGVEGTEASAHKATSASVRPEGPSEANLPGDWERLFFDNFDRGNADGWSLVPGWKVEKDGGNFVLSGTGHAPFASAGNPSWSDYSVKLRLKLVRGGTHINFRATMASPRYLLGVHSEGIILRKSVRNQPATTVVQTNLAVGVGAWHAVEIVGLADHLEVNFDGRNVIDFIDQQEPILQGAFSFETQPDAYVLFDDVEVRGKPVGTIPVKAQVGEHAGGSVGGAGPQQVSPSQRWTNSLGMVFVSVPGTDVQFSIWETRVQDFEAFVNATRHDMGNEMVVFKSGRNQTQAGYNWKAPGFARGPTHPVVGASWDDARAFCAWLTAKERREGRLASDQTYRLPTDLEWSGAAGLGAEPGRTPQERSGQTKGYHWGNQWPPPAGFGNLAGEEARDIDWPAGFQTITGYNDGYPRTAPVGSFRANRFGLYDLEGNVLEWAEDLQGEGATKRTIRWGSWFAGRPDWCSPSFRSFEEPTFRASGVGFRLVLAGGSIPK
jgi:formylglycine-generating enzyme required for sulfatase activity